LSLGSGVSGASPAKAHPPHVSLLSQPGTRPGIRPVIRTAPGWRTGTALPLSRGLSARRHWLLGRPVPARGLGSPYGRLTGSAQAAPPDPDGVSTFRTHEMRPGRVSSLPRERRCSLRPSGRPRPPSAALQRLAPATPVLHTGPGCQIDEASTRIQGHSPFRPSPHLWHPARTGTLGLSPELRTRPLPATHVRVGTGLEHKPEVTSSASRRTSNRRTYS
jgi:hypothetical protein